MPAGDQAHRLRPVATAAASQPRAGLLAARVCQACPAPGPVSQSSGIPSKQERDLNQPEHFRTALSRSRRSTSSCSCLACSCACTCENAFKLPARDRHEVHNRSLHYLAMRSHQGRRGVAKQIQECLSVGLRELDCVCFGVAQQSREALLHTCSRTLRRPWWRSGD